jgi:hypothetical protein
MQRILTGILAAFGLALAVPPVASASPPSGRWVLTGGEGATLQLELRWPDGSQWRRTIAAAELHGLPGGGIAAAGSAPVAFRIEQDAGSFVFEGSAGGGRGTGDFSFTPRREFVAALHTLGVSGVGEVSDRDLMNLAFGLVSSSAIREFQAMGLSPLSYGDVMELAVQQVSPTYMRTMQSLGVPGINTVRSVVSLRQFGVTPELVQELAALGTRGVDGEGLVSLRHSGVTPAFVRQVREAGYREVTPQALVEMKKRGIGTASRGGAPR